MSIQDYKSHMIKGIKDTFHYLNQHKLKALSSITIIALLTAGAYKGEQQYQSNFTEVYHVYLHGAEIGVVDSPKVVETWLADKMANETHHFQGFDLQMNTDVTYEPELVYKGTFNNESTLGILANSVEVKAKAFRLVIDGEFIGFVKDKATADAILDSIKQQYTQEFDKGKTVAIASLLDHENIPVTPTNENAQGDKLKSVSIKEDVNISPTIIDPAAMTDEASIVATLTETVQSRRTYTVEKGDYLGKIALQSGLKTAELLKLNPGLTEKSVLQIGQQLYVTGVDSKLTVQTVIEQKKTESIKFETTYIDDNTQYSDVRKTKQAGARGEKLVTYEVVKENGYEVDRKAVGERVVTEPVTEIIIRGTKARPYVSTGKFIWPAKGGIVTSGYGYRWGKMHSGIDISGVKDKTIMAADGGKVTFAGWKKSFGNLVIIDHGGGYETYYAHLSSISVSKDDKVGQGQKIGVMGSTGDSTGTHLHFEIRINGATTNPSKAFK